MRAGEVRGKDVKWLAAFLAGPEIADGRGGMALRARAILAAGGVVEAEKQFGLFKTLDTVEEDENTNHAVPDGDLRRDSKEPDRKEGQTAYANKAQNGSGHQAAGAAEKKPQDGAEDLSAIEGINGEQIKNEEDEVDVPDGAEVIGNVAAPVGIGKPPQEGQNGNQEDVYQGTGGDAPEHGAGALRRSNIGHAAEGPENDLIRLSSDGTAGEGVPKLVDGDNEKQGEILKDVPGDGGIGAFAGFNFIERDHEPGPMEVNVDSKEFKEVNGAFPGWHDVVGYIAFPEPHASLPGGTVSISSPAFNSLVIENSVKIADFIRVAPIVLIVDDEGDFIELVKFRLAGLGCEFLVATDGVQALSQARQYKPNLILLDILLPDLDGLSVCEILKRQPATKKIPIIFMSALSAGVTKRTVAVQAEDFFTKPLDLPRLERRVGELLHVNGEE